MSVFLQCCLVFLGGGIGSMCRYLVGHGMIRYVESDWPWATWVVNIVGSLCIGMLFAYFSQATSKDLLFRLLLITGFCGGFTTFSAFSLENLQMLQQGQISKFFVYSSSSIVLGLLAVWLGYRVFQS